VSEQDPRVAFCHREHRRLVGALTLYCGDAELARDLAQEALARACRDWSKVSRMAAPGAYVHRRAGSSSSAMPRGTLSTMNMSGRNASRVASMIRDRSAMVCCSGPRRVRGR